MRKTKARMLIAAAAAAVLLLGGCGDAPYEMTDEEENIIASYSAHILSKYNIKQKDGLTYVNLQAPEETEDVPLEEVPEDTQTPEEPVETTDGNEVTVPEEEPHTIATFQEIFGADGLEVSYVGARIAADYIEDAYYAVDPAAGNAYLIVGIDISNTTDSPMEVNILDKMPGFRIKLNGNMKYSSEMTILTDDFSNYEETIDGGQTAETVLLFQIPDTVATVETLTMDVSVNGNNYQINLETAEN